MTSWDECRALAHEYETILWNVQSGTSGAEEKRYGRVSEETLRRTVDLLNFAAGVLEAGRVQS